MARIHARRRVGLCLPPLLAALLLSACGGGGDGALLDASGQMASPGPGAAPAPVTVAQAGAAPSPVVAPDKPAPSADAGLDPHPPEVIDTAPAGERVVKAVGALDDGGHVVLWMSRAPVGPGVTWSLWGQRFDAEGRRVGEPVAFEIPPDVVSAQDVAVNVLPEGHIGVNFVTDRIESDIYMITEVHHWPYSLEGRSDGMQRVLDTERYARFSPRFARLAGPLAASTGRDGSQYVSWRYQIAGAPPLAPSVRAERLAADGEPLGWIQRLDGEGWSRVYDVDLTSLDESGWVVALERVSPAGVRYRTFTQLDVPRPLAMPLTETQAAGAFLLDLRGHGSVLFTADVDPDTGVQASPRSLHFTWRGAAEPARGLPALPVAAVALRGGDYLTLVPDGAQLVAQRYTAAGDPVGAPFLTVAVPGAVGTGLRPGGLALAWSSTAPDGRVEVVVQFVGRR